MDLVYLLPSLKMWPISTALPRRRGWLADGVEFAFDDVADVRDDGGFEVAAGRDVAEVVLLLVGSGDEVLAAFQSLVEEAFDERETPLACRETCRSEAGAAFDADRA